MPYTPTSRNQPVRNFLEEVGRSYEDLEDGGRLYWWLAREAAAIKLDALRSPLGGGTSTLGGNPLLEASFPSKVALERNALLHRIAEELADPRAVVKAIKSFKSPWDLNAPKPVKTASHSNGGSACRDLVRPAWVLRYWDRPQFLRTGR